MKNDCYNAFVYTSLLQIITRSVANFRRLYKLRSKQLVSMRSSSRTIRLWCLLSHLHFCKDIWIYRVMHWKHTSAVLLYRRQKWPKQRKRKNMWYSKPSHFITWQLKPPSCACLHRHKNIWISQQPPSTFLSLNQIIHWSCGFSRRKRRYTGNSDRLSHSNMTKRV